MTSHSSPSRQQGCALRAALPSLLPLLASLCMPFLAVACGSDFAVSQNAAALIADPGLIDFGTLPVGGISSTRVTLAAEDGQVTVLGMELLNVDGSYLDVDNSDLPVIPRNGTAEVELTYTPLASGAHWGELKIITDAEQTPEQIVQVRGLALDNLVRVYPALIDYGPVKAGEATDATLTLVNQGSTDLTLSSLLTDNGVFAATTDLPVILSAGERTAVTIEFLPLDTNAANGSLTIGFDEFTGAAPVTLRGNDCATAAGDLYDVDGDGFGWCGGDCDDWNADAHAGGTETCDGADNDCDGTVDEDTTCSDDDGDGYAEVDGDCNDGDATVGPDATEIAGNGIDDDCDGVVDDGSVDADGDGYTAEAGDCDDSDATIGPAMSETPDGRDDDCNGLVDDETPLYDDDGDGYSEIEGDCDDTDPAVNPDATETANWIDDDCDSIVDEDTDYGDDDGDGFSEVGGDCDDADADRNPGQTEIIGDGIDNDCDGVTA